MIRLIEYLPPFLRDIAEIKAVFSAIETELERLSAETDRRNKNMNVLTADAAGLKRLAESYGINAEYADPESLRFNLYTVFLCAKPYNKTLLRESLEALCGKNGFTLERDLQTQTVKLRLNLSNKDKWDSAEDLLDRVLPANMIIDIDCLYNTHSMYSGKTHAELSAYTHEYMRSGAAVGKESI